VFVRLRQPKVVGEILAGVLLGPSLLGRIRAASWIAEAVERQADILNFVHWLGLLLLMFLSGAEAQRLFTHEDRKQVAWLTIVGTGIPFGLGLTLGPWLIRPALAGTNGNRISLIIILAVGVAVTSVPVVSKIFSDLKILHTRFARLVLGSPFLRTSCCGSPWHSRQHWQGRRHSIPKRSPITVWQPWRTLRLA